MNKSEESVLANRHITPESFVKFAWDLNFRVSIADAEVLHPDFIEQTTKLATQNGIGVHFLDFSNYDTASSALSARENAKFLAAIEDGSKKSLLWFVNCESLAPLYIDVTYSLSTILTTRQTSNTQSVFIANNTALLNMFANREAPFYQSHFRLTGYSVK